MGTKFKKIDAVIVVVLIVLAGLVLYKAGYIFPEETRETVTPDWEDIPPLTPKLPESLTAGYMRAVSPKDEGVHFDKIRIRENMDYHTKIEVIDFYMHIIENSYLNINQINVNMN